MAKRDDLVQFEVRRPIGQTMGTSGTAASQQLDSASRDTAPEKRSVRLDSRLCALATRAASTAHRSVPNQIEFWAALGRALEHRLTATETRDLLSGERFVARVEVASATSVDPDDVFAALETERASGTLAARLARTTALYDSAGAPEGLVRRLEPDGSESFGRFDDGTWVGESPGSER